MLTCGSVAKPSGYAVNLLGPGHSRDAEPLPRATQELSRPGLADDGVLADRFHGSPGPQDMQTVSHSITCEALMAC